MKLNRSTIIALALLIIICSLYRIIPDRKPGFAPIIAMTIFGGLVIREKVWAFLLPILSLFISDCLYQIMYVQGLTKINGFYDGMWSNYLLTAGLTFLPIIFKKMNLINIFVLSVASPTVYFLISNLFVWIGGGGHSHPKTLSGLMQTLVDGVPFYQWSLLATVLFSGVFFGAYFLLRRTFVKSTLA